MRLPKQIRIMGKRYTVVEFPDDGPQFDGHIGTSSFNYGKIYVHEKLPDDQKLDTFLHEVFHRINEDMALELDESKIVRIAAGFTGFLLENGINVDFKEKK